MNTNQPVTDLVPVVTPSLNDIHAVRQVGDTRDKRESLAQALSLAAGVGKVVQTSFVQDGEVSTGTGTIPEDDTIPQISEGDEYLTLSHTPLDAANLLHFFISGMFTNPSQSRFTMALFQGVVNDALACSFQRGDDGDEKFINFQHQIIANGTSAITFRMRAGADAAGTTTFNGSGGTRIMGGVLASSIYIMEVQP